jgi:ribonuclease D
MANLPASPTALVTTPDQLAAVCQHLRAAGAFAFDTEFIGENTYQPVLCLIQVATSQRVELIDPFTLQQDGLRPFWELLADESVEKICHAGDQDVEIVWLESGLVTRNMFDTQIGAGMLGITYPTALWRAVEYFTGVSLEKAHTYSAWNRRPLTGEQFAYAVDDVRYLPAIHQAMKQQIEALGHTGWMRAACDEMCAEASQPSDARALFMKIRGAAGLKTHQLAVLREVTALREQIAYEHNVPARAFVKDEVLYDMASRPPTTVAELARIRDMPSEEVDTYGEDFLGAVKAGLAVAEADRPSIFIPGEDSAEVKRLVENMWVAAQAICLGQQVNPALVTSQSEIAALARLVHRKKPVEGHPLMRGWHRDCLGEKLAALVRGELHVDLTMEAEVLKADFTARGK